MKKVFFCFCFVMTLIIIIGFNAAQAVNVTIIESTSFNAGHVMDSKWQTECTAMGYTSTIMPQTTLDNTAFFATTDILIISSGVGALPANRIQTIVDFVQSGKPAYIQGEYLPSYDSNLAFKKAVDSTGDSFNIGFTVSGTLAPMNVLGTFATTPNVVPPLTYFWYGNTGTGTNITYFLEYGGNYFGFFHCPSNPAWGSVCQTTDQDWINTSTQPLLMRNILYHLQNCSSPFSMTVSPNVAICHGQSTTLTATGGGTYLWSNTQTTASIVVSPAVTTTYTVTVTNGGNSGSGTVTVTVNPIPTVTATAAPASICAGQSSVLTGSGATTYSWMPGSLSGTSVTVTPAITTTYTVTGTGAGGCTNTATVTVTVNPIPTVTASASPTSICAGQSSVLTGGGATTYLWNPGGLSGTSVTVTPAVTTTYTVTGTGTGGCTNTATVTVTVNPIPTVTATASPASICAGQSSVLTGAGATTYSWNPGGLSGTSVTVTPATTTIYTVTGTGTGGCTNTATVTVTVNPIPTVTASAAPATICSGQSSVLTGSGATTYSWMPGSLSGTTVTVTPGTTTTYSVTGTGPGGCTNTATVTVTVTSTVVPSVSIVAVPAGPICSGTSVTFTATPTNGGTTPSYQWQINGMNAGTNSPTFTSTTFSNGDVITVIMTSNSPCASPTTATSNSITMVVTATVIPSVSIAAVPAGTICIGTSVTFTATPTNGGSTPSYQWQVNGVNAGTNSNTFTSTTLNNGDVVTVILTSNAPCAVPTTATSNTITMVVTSTVVPSVSIAAVPSGTICAGTSVTFTATPTNGGTTPGYQWQVNGVNVGTNSDTYTSATLNNGDVITVVLTSNSPCAVPTTATSNSITMVVTASVVPSVTIAAVPSGVICAGTSVSFTATPTNGGTTPSYQWQVNGVNAGTNSPTFTSNTLNNGDVITVILTSNAPCAVPTTATSNTITMTVTAVPTASITPANPSYCSGDSVVLNGAGGTTYAWSPSTGLSCTNCQSPTAHPTTTTTYTLTVSNGSCTATTTVTVTVTPMPVPHITGDLTLCEGMSTTLTASGGNTYVWSTGDSTASIVIDTLLTTTSYTVTVSNGACTATAIATVVVSPIPVADAGPDTTIDVGAMIQLHGTGGTTYSWSPIDALSCFTCPDPYADPEGTTTYILTVTNAAGCTDTDTITVYVNMECGEVFVPNIFTPNGDGRNDILFARGNCIKTMTFSVYDRWGEKVFESTDPGFGWDGKLRDKPMDPGIFVYCLKALLFTGDEIVKKGNVTLVR